MMVIPRLPVRCELLRPSSSGRAAHEAQICERDCRASPLRESRSGLSSSAFSGKGCAVSLDCVRDLGEEARHKRQTRAGGPRQLTARNRSGWI